MNLNWMTFHGEPDGNQRMTADISVSSCRGNAVLLALVIFMSSPVLRAETAEKLFTMHCSACHAVDRQVVGPSLVEISGVYKDDPQGFLKWCLEPYNKREGAVEMPSMAHVGEANLELIRAYMLEAAKGKVEVVEAPSEEPEMPLERPKIQRIFLSGASPAAIAVAMPGELSYCFDASACRLRYVWKGGFIDGVPYWKGNGSSQAEINGEKVYIEPSFPLDVGDAKAEPKFLGYRIGADGLPTFLYRRGGLDWSETIHPRSDGKGIDRHFEVSEARVMNVIVADGVDVTPSKVSTRSFTLSFRWK